MRLGPVAAVSVVLVLTALGIGQAQNAVAPKALVQKTLDPQTLAQDMPPADYVGGQFVDAKGCVFARAPEGSTAPWLARLDRSGQPLCGYPPTQIAAPRTASAGAADPAPETPAPETPAPVAAAARAAAQPLAIREIETIPGSESGCPNRPALAQRYILSDGRRILRCDAGTDDPAAFINRAALPGVRIAVQPAGQDAPAARPAEPASGAGRHRAGIRQQDRQKREGQMQAGLAFVQVGAFLQPQNAERAQARIAGLGLPVARAQAGQGGRRLTLIFAGPFADPRQAREALRTLRRNGFPDAYLR